MRTGSSNARLVPTAIASAITIVLAGCSPSGDNDGTSTTDAEASDGVVAVATTTQLGDVAGQVAQCAGGSVETLMGPGDDPHDFSVSSAQMATMAEAPLVIVNGLGLEGGLDTALTNAVADGATLLEVAPLVDPIPFSAADDHDHEGEETEDAHADHDHEGEETEDAHADHDHEGEETEDAHAGHNHGSEDPHFWHDVARMAVAAEEIGHALAEQTGDDAYATCGTELKAELEEIDAEVTEILGAVPDDNRVIISDHAAFGYLADAYDFDVAGVVIPGGSTDAEPSSEELAALVETIRETGVSAIFSNNAAANALVDAVAAEVGEIDVVELFEGSLGEPGSEGDTYVKAVLANAQRIADALS